MSQVIYILQTITIWRTIKLLYAQYASVVPIHVRAGISVLVFMLYSERGVWAKIADLVLKLSVRWRLSNTGFHSSTGENDLGSTTWWVRLGEHDLPPRHPGAQKTMLANIRNYILSFINLFRNQLEARVCKVSFLGLSALLLSYSVDAGIMLKMYSN